MTYMENLQHTNTKRRGPKKVATSHGDQWKKTHRQYLRYSLFYFIFIFILILFSFYLFIDIVFKTNLLDRTLNRPTCM